MRAVPDNERNRERHGGCEEEEDAQNGEHHERDENLTQERPAALHVERAIERVGQALKEVLARPGQCNQRERTRDTAKLHRVVHVLGQHALNFGGEVSDER